MLDQALEALKTFDWGTPLAVVAPIEDAVAAVNDKPENRRQLEDRLISALKRNLSRDARDYVCRKLAIVGSAACVPMLAGLLLNKDSSHMARFALERIPGPETTAALLDALFEMKGGGPARIGIIGSLGARCSAAAVPALEGLFKNSDAETTRAIALSLGAIGTAEAATVLQAELLRQQGKSDVSALFDGLLNCAEALIAAQKLPEATAIYEKLNDPQQPRLIRLAATRGLLACAARQA